MAAGDRDGLDLYDDLEDPFFPVAKGGSLAEVSDLPSCHTPKPTVLPFSYQTPRPTQAALFLFPMKNWMN